MGLARLPDFDAERPPDLSGVLMLDQLAPGGPPPGMACGQVALAFGERSRSRLRVRYQRTDAAGKGQQGEAGIVLPRGNVLRGGAWVMGEELALQVLAADQDLLEVRARADDANPGLALVRAAYHLGNRHVALEVAPGRLLLEYDYVLADMLVAMGLQIRRCHAPFEPEWGAYAAGHGH